MATLIRNGIVFPMAGPAASRFDPGSVLIDGNTHRRGRPGRRARRRPACGGRRVVDATDHAVIPGLHNCHLHSGLLRGTAESMSLWDWLKAYVDPAHKALTPEIARAASLQCYAESLLAGTTSVMDMWRFMEGSADVAAELGIRATLVPYVADEEGFDYFESIESNRRLLESHAVAADGRVRTLGRARAPHVLHEGVLRAGRRADGRVRHRAPHALVGVDLGGRGVAEALGPAPDRGVLRPRHPRAAHRRRALRVALRPRDRAARADRHRGRALPDART